MASLELTPSIPSTASTVGGDHCGTCRFWQLEERNSARAIGRCRRSPPVLLPSDSWSLPIEISYFPETEKRDWCGEYQGPVPVVGI